MKKVLKCLIILFSGCIGLGFIVSKLEKKKGWVEGHKPYGLYEKHVKRPLDFGLALFALLVFWPVLLIIAIVVRVNLGSPVVFKQERPGAGGKTFYLLKYRTMLNTKGTDGDLLPDDQRMTPIGSRIRELSIDETLEAINVLKGDMSIVGPRPLLVEYLDRYSEEQAHRHDVRPGLTGLAQTEGRNFCSWDEKFEKDVKYVNHITFFGDLKIILKTIVVVLKREGIHSETSATVEYFQGNDNEEV